MGSDDEEIKQRKSEKAKTTPTKIKKPSTIKKEQNIKTKSPKTSPTTTRKPSSPKKEIKKAKSPTNDIKKTEIKLNVESDEKEQNIKSPKTPLNDEYDEKEREEMIERRRDRRRAQRKADKEIEAEMNLKKKKQQKFKIGDTVRVVNLNGIKVKYPGIIRWVGLLDEELDANKFIKGATNKIKKTFGIELLEHDGDNNGRYNDKQYFTTKEGAKRGVFIKRINFRKHHVGEVTKRRFKDAVKKKKGRRQRNDAQMYGNMFDNLWTERIDIMGGNGRGVTHKMGPREIGTVHGWKGYKYDENASNVHKNEQPKEKVFKAGPRDIGTVHGWKGYKFDENNGNIKKSKKELTQKEKQQLIKQGPRDIGTVRGWRGMKLDNDYIIKLRLKKQRQKELEKQKKLKSEFDPRNISKPKDWKGLKYDESEQRLKRLERKRKIMEKKRAMAKAENVKFGPRDIEKPKNWKGMKYDEEEAAQQRA